MSKANNCIFMSFYSDTSKFGRKQGTYDLLSDVKQYRL